MMKSQEAVRKHVIWWSDHEQETDSVLRLERLFSDEATTFQLN